MILVNGALAAYLARGDRQLVTWLPDAEPDRSKVARAVAHVLIDRARTGGDAPRGMLIEEIDGVPPSEHPLSPYLSEAGFVFDVGTEERITEVITSLHSRRDTDFGNARDIRTLFDETMERQAARLSRDESADSALLQPNDIPA